MNRLLLFPLLSLTCLLLVQAAPTTKSPTHNGCDASAKVATIDQGVSVTVKSGETAWVAVLLGEAEKDAVNHVVITADENSETLIGHARLYLSSGELYETFGRYGYILVYGEASISGIGCLSINLDDPKASGTFEISLNMTKYKTAYLGAVFMTAFMAVLFTVLSVATIPRIPHSIFHAFFRPHESLKVVGIFFVLELFAGIPGFFVSRHVYVTDFLAGNQDACNYDFVTFLVNDGYPQFESFLTHFGYFAAALILVVVWNLENHDSVDCLMCTDGPECWHWNLGRMLGVSAFFLGIRSAGYHYCPTAWTAALDFGGQVVCSLISTIFLRQQRKVWSFPFKQVVAVIAFLTAMLYAGSLAETYTWFSVIYGFVTFVVSCFLLRPLISYLRNESSLCFSYSAQAVPYTYSTQKKAAILEIILCVCIVQAAFWIHAIGHLDFGMAVNVTSYGLLIVSLLVELALRLRYKLLSSRAKLTSSILITAFIATAYLNDHGSSYSDPASISRADSGGAFFSVFNKHDLFHVSTAVVLCAAGLTAMFFPDIDRKRK